ncbi:hypothetical protein DdX_13678 [Ditylenchus destructor]|uniref:Uncharacterized protein n=1 Tax=Ditylenchus destructor TaxID=166010 RepID=A0AAD4QZC0_9BILA|nr:hypothetical protein DdX_13678 [Ditylenchus destructor]
MFPKNCLVAASVIGFFTFFPLYFHESIYDTAFEMHWIKYSQVFGYMPHPHDMLMNLMKWRQIGALVGCVVAVGLSCLRIFSIDYNWQLGVLGFSSCIVGLSGFSAAVSVPLGESCANCTWLRVGKLFFGLCSTINWCFGVTYLYGTSRQKVHKRQRELMGFMAIFVVAGESFGLVCGFSLKNYEWLITHSGIRIITPILFLLAYHFSKFCLQDYGEGIDDTQVIAEEGNCEGQRNSSICDLDFWLRLLRSVLLFTFVDFTRNMYKMTFEEIFEKIGADSSNVPPYTLIFEGIAIVCCIISISLAYRFHCNTQYKLFAMGCIGLGALVWIFGWDISPVETTHHIGIVVGIYTVQSALCMECLLELLPDLFLAHNFALGWAITLLIRHLVTLALFFFHQSHIVKLPTWFIFGMCAVFQFVFLLSVITPREIISWFNHRSQTIPENRSRSMASDIVNIEDNTSSTSQTPKAIEDAPVNTSLVQSTSAADRSAISANTRKQKHNKQEPNDVERLLPEDESDA